MAEKWKKGWPRCVGLYDCLLSDGREVVVDCDPWSDDELIDGVLLDVEITAFRRIPGQRYRTPSEARL